LHENKCIFQIFQMKSIINYLMEKHPQHFDVAREVFQQIEKGQVYGIASILVLTEILTKPIKDNNEN